jgi:competence protein ComEC
VASDPERRADSLHANIAVSSVHGISVDGTLLAILGRDAGLQYGDTVIVRGEIDKAEAFETDTGRMFDYENYLRVQGVSALLRYATLEEAKAGGPSLQRYLYALKHSFESSLERLFAEPSGSLLEGVLLGERRGLPDELNKAFIVSGLVHVVALSGYNIAVVANAVLYATSFLPRALGYAGGGGLMVLFVMMTGAGATSVRACIMGLVAILAQYLHRPAAAMRSLIFAAGAMALWNPLVALYDPSFILSVLATFGLITLSSTVEDRLRFLPEKMGVRSIAASTVSVQVFVLPALLYFTGVLSFLSLPANILALPVVPFAMLFGFIAGLLGWVAPALGFPFAFIADLLLEWMMLVANAVYALPFSSVVVAAFPAWVALAAYAPLTWLAVKRYLRTASRSPTN